MNEDLKKKVDEGGELISYLIIDEIGALAWRMNHDMAHDRIPKEDWPAIDKDILKLAEVQVYAVSQLTRFGIVPFVDNDPGKLSEDYRKWYRWWKDYIESLPEATWAEISRKIDEKQDISAYRPAGKS